jgi:hypothetical protein
MGDLGVLRFALLLCLEGCMLLLLLPEVILSHMLLGFGLYACRIVPGGPCLVGWVCWIVGPVMVHCCGVSTVEGSVQVVIVAVRRQGVES